MVKNLTVAAVLILGAFALSGCVVRKVPFEVKVPVAVPCIKEPIVLEPVPLAKVSPADLQALLDAGEYSKYLDIVVESFVITKAQLDGLKKRIEACQ